MANQNVLDLRDVAAKSRELEGQVVTVEGWVRNHRKQKSIGFIEFYDGTVLAPMQIVYDDQVKDFAAVQAIRNGAAVRATGKLVPGRNGALEMQAAEIILEGDCTEDYPLQPKRHTLEFLRDIAYLRRRSACSRRCSASAPSRRRRCTTTSRAAATCMCTPADHRERRGGARQHLYRDQSGDGQALQGGERFLRPGDRAGRDGSALRRRRMRWPTSAYTFGPTFRAENSNTKTHAAEFG